MHRGHSPLPQWTAPNPPTIPFLAHLPFKIHPSSSFFSLTTDSDLPATFHVGQSTAKAVKLYYGW